MSPDLNCDRAKGSVGLDQADAHRKCGALFGECAKATLKQTLKAARSSAPMTSLD